MPIKVLEPELASQIAAGEVVERPVSVVKELVENSLDAGAFQITVEIKGGGVDQVRVIDDGEGIPADQVALAFQHHATSKLTRQEQLDCIGTLGFRGEAIPSIAAVSQMTMTTRPHDTGGGQQVQYQWGQKVSEGSQGCSPGTSVTVSDLFANLPARRKFLKSNSAETARIRELIDRYALAFPGVRFQLVVEGRTSVATPGSGRPEEALLAVYGPEIASGMLRVQEDDPESGYGVDGFVSAPRLNRANRTYMTFFINRRWIQSRMLSFALEEAYHGLLPERRYPLAALNLTVPYSDVDVNSHPAKREVRFVDESKVYSTLQRAVRAALIADSPVPVLGRSGFGSGQPSANDGAASPSFFRSAFDRPGSSGRGAGGQQGNEYGALTAAGFTPQQALPALRVVGQVRLTYIVAEGPDGMYLVDQHAAHERVLFDRIVRKAADQSPESQPLLAPMTVDLTPGQAEAFHNNLAFLAAYGFEVEAFGENSYLLRAVPSVMTSQNPAQSLVDILDMVAFEGLLRQHDDVLAASIACHSAIRAGKSLTEPEMRALLEELEVTDNPHTCPHGRPTLIHFSEYQMDREFGRR
ncbi:MAG: DNA mismatch repair endonuclease MutL [Chloroflexi bacterium]|nr:DNA mismatch repair endonuclease MutL [Chloroflexota bacterium]PKB57130.1 MAG: hypothetical protein BZY73_04880 [SAR202 cluster bacterium Casp-Chloro-G3]